MAAIITQTWGYVTRGTIPLPDRTGHLQTRGLVERFRGVLACVDVLLDECLTSYGYLVGGGFGGVMVLGEGDGDTVYPFPEHRLRREASAGASLFVGSLYAESFDSCKAVTFLFRPNTPRRVSDGGNVNIAGKSSEVIVREPVGVVDGQTSAVSEPIKGCPVVGQFVLCSGGNPTDYAASPIMRGRVASPFSLQNASQPQHLAMPLGADAVTFFLPHLGQTLFPRVPLTPASVRISAIDRFTSMEVVVVGTWTGGRVKFKRPPTRWRVIRPRRSSSRECG
jgi:hypothetical protein